MEAKMGGDQAVMYFVMSQPWRYTKRGIYAGGTEKEALISMGAFRKVTVLWPWR
jgi:hypothetical protein